MEEEMENNIKNVGEPNRSNFVQNLSNKQRCGKACNSLEFVLNQLIDVELERMMYVEYDTDWKFENEVEYSYVLDLSIRKLSVFIQKLSVFDKLGKSILIPYCCSPKELPGYSQEEMDLLFELMNVN
jgi:hypothetical protein